MWNVSQYFNANLYDLIKNKGIELLVTLIDDVYVTTVDLFLN